MNNVWTRRGDFIATAAMIVDGKFIEGMIPDIVKGNFYCNHNRLTTLEGGPKEVGEHFSCSYNKLTSLEGGPKKVVGVFLCVDNNNSLIIEKEFIKSGGFKNDFYLDLLNYCITNKIDLEKVESWSDDFITDNILTSTKGICKFNL